MKKELYEEQKNNCLFGLVISALFIIGMTFKTIYGFKSIEDIKLMIFMVLPVLFMNTTFFVLLQVYKNQLEDNLLKKENVRLINSLTYIVMLFVISIMILIHKDTTGLNQTYSVILTGIYFLFFGYLVKKIFNYELKNHQ